jgi:hypothetical protein
MAGITTSPKFRESPEIAKLQVSDSPVARDIRGCDALTIRTKIATTGSPARILRFLFISFL